MRDLHAVRKAGTHSHIVFWIFFCKFGYSIKEIIMGKGKDAKKTTKKPPTKTAKEKKAEKKLKKTNKN